MRDFELQETLKSSVGLVQILYKAMMSYPLLGSALAFILSLLFHPITLFIILLVIWFLWQRRRGPDYGAVAERLGLSYSLRQPIKTTWLWTGEGRGGNLRVWHFLEGTFESHPVQMFETHGVDNFTSFGFMMKHNGDFPFLGIQRIRKLADKPVYALINKFARITGQSPAVEISGDPLSDEFAKTFRVTSKDEEFARAVLHQGMMEYLLRNRSVFRVKFGGQHVTLLSGRPRGYFLSTYPKVRPEDIEPALRQLSDIYNLIPKHLFGTRTVSPSERE